MKIIKNEKLIVRNKKFGQWTSLGALGVLGLGMYISWQKPELIAYAFASLLVGFTLTQVGMYLGNRFGRSPRPDEKLDAGLKGLTGEFSLYHYMTPASHLLIGPAGIWVLMPYHQRGAVTFRKNRWRMGGGGVLQGYMRIFGQESIGRPELEAENEIQAVNKMLTKELGDAAIPEVRAALVFTSEAVEIDSQDADMPALKIKQLKDFMRQKAKERPLSALILQRIKSVIPG
jgi:hypothetical protein